MALHDIGTAIKANIEDTNGRRTCRKNTKPKFGANRQRRNVKEIRGKTLRHKNIVELFIQWSIVLYWPYFLICASLLLPSKSVVAEILATVSPTSSSITNTTTSEDEEAEWKETSNLVVCLPENSTSCVKYINSTNHGLIALNGSIYPALKAFKGDYDYRLIARINPFWLKFEPPDDTFYNTMATLYMLIFLLGALGNGLVIYVFARCKEVEKLPHILVLNLAISDFLIGFKCFLAALNNYMRAPVLGDWGCRFYGFIEALNGTASNGMLTIITIDRFKVVVNPLSSRYYALGALYVWLYALIFSSAPLTETGLSRYVPEAYLTTCSFDYLDKSIAARLFMFLFFIFSYIIPLPVICFSYCHKLNKVFSVRDGDRQRNQIQQKIRMWLITSVLLTIILWFLTWIPNFIVAIYGIFGLEEYLTPSRIMILGLFCQIASCLNPFMYSRTSLMHYFSIM